MSFDAKTGENLSEDQKQKKSSPYFDVIFDGILGEGDQTKQRKLIWFLGKFLASSSWNHSWAAKSSNASRMRPAKRGLGSPDLSKS